MGVIEWAGSSRNLGHFQAQVLSNRLSFQPPKAVALLGQILGLDNNFQLCHPKAPLAIQPGLGPRAKASQLAVGASHAVRFFPEAGIFPFCREDYKPPPYIFGNNRQGRVIDASIRYWTARAEVRHDPGRVFCVGRRTHQDNLTQIFHNKIPKFRRKS